MEQQIWPRLGAVGGILFVALLFGGDSIPLGEHGQGVVEVAGLLLFLPFLGYLWSVLRRAEGENGWISATALGAGVVDLSIKLGSGAPSIAARNLEEGPLHDALHAMNSASFILTMLPLGVLVGAATVVILKTRVLPAWIGWLGVVTAPALLVNGTFFEAEFGPAFPLFALWTVLTSAVLTLRAGREEAKTAGAKPARPEPAS